MRNEKGQFIKGYGEEKSDVDMEELSNRYQSGQSMKQIAREMKFGINTIRKRLNKLGITERRDGIFYMKNKEKTQFKKGQHSRAWKGGTRLHNGYLQLWINGRYVREHIYIMEDIIGRKLEKDECVHHLNHNRLDNRISNLKLMTKSDHARLHSKERYKNKTHPFIQKAADAAGRSS